MKEMIISEQLITDYIDFLKMEEKSSHTISKYSHDVRTFVSFMEKQTLNKAIVMEYKDHLIQKGYAIDSINSMLAAINSFLTYIGCGDCKVKHLRFQKKIYCREDRELNKAEYLRLLEAAENQPRLRMIIETICSTGIRISELK